MKKLIFCFGLMVFIIHITAISLFSLPTNPLTYTYYSAVNKYMFPFFHQKWNLFAPQPALSSLQLWYRCKKYDSDWSEFYNPVASLLRKHQSNRLSNYGMILRIYNDIPRELNNRAVILKKELACEGLNNHCIDNFNLKLEKTAEFRLAYKFAYDLCSKDDKEKLNRGTEMLQLQIVEIYPKNFPKKHESKIFGKINVRQFPPIMANKI